MTASVLRSRAQELALDDDAVAEWETQVDPTVAEALLASLIRFEEALRELAR